MEWDVRAHGEEQQVGLIVVTTGSIYSKRLNGTNFQFPASFHQPHPAQFQEIDFYQATVNFHLSREEDRRAASCFQLPTGPKVPYQQYRNCTIIFG